MRIGVPRESKEGERRVGLGRADGRDPRRRWTRSARRSRVRAHGIGARRRRLSRRRRPHRRSRRGLGSRARREGEGDPAGADFGNVRARGSTLFCFQHLAGEPERPRRLAARASPRSPSRWCATRAGGFPLLAPMSVIAGRLAIEVGAQLLTLPAGGNGTLLAGCPGAHRRTCSCSARATRDRAPPKSPPRSARRSSCYALAPTREAILRAPGRRRRGRPRHAGSDRARSARRRPRRGRRLRRRRAHAEAPAALAGRAHEPRLDDRGRVDRRGRRRGDVAADHPRQAHLRRRRASSTTAWPTCPPRCPRARRRDLRGRAALRARARRPRASPAPFARIPPCAPACWYGTGA